MNAKANVLVYGAGAVGSIFGWRLAHQGFANVSVVCRSNFHRVKETGFLFRTRAWGNGSLTPFHVFQGGRLTAGPLHPFDYIICANKLIDGECPTTIRDLQHVVGPQTTLVSAQNGMDVERPLQRAFPSNPILSAVCNIGCNQIHPGFVVQTGLIKPHAFHLGIYSQGRASEAASRARDELASVDGRFKTIDCVPQERWRKLVFNCAFNSTCALTGLDTLELLAQPGAAELVFRLASEAHQVAMRAGVQLDEDLPAKIIGMARSSPAITPSTLQDARSGRPMELSTIFGYLVAQAAKLGVHVPHTKVVYAQLQQMNRTLTAGRCPRLASTPSLHTMLAGELAGEQQQQQQTGVVALAP